MEKEINLTSNNIHVNFYFEEFNLSLPDIKSYSDALEKIASAFSWFLADELSLKMESNVNITLCQDEKIQELNAEYRNKNKTTDVLSFPLQDNIREGEYDKHFPELELGDIFVCHSVCESQAKEFNITYFDEWIHLIVHGLLHLTGYDHEISFEEEKLMESFEKKIIDKISSLS